MLPQYNGGDHLETRTVYYSGTDKLVSGYAVAFDVAASAVATDPKLRLGNVVVKPVTANLNAFAGIVAPQSDGVTGPAFIDILIPRKNALVNARTKVNATIATTALGLVNNQYELGSFADATLNLGLVGMAMSTADTSAAAGTQPIQFK